MKHIIIGFLCIIVASIILTFIYYMCGRSVSKVETSNSQWNQDMVCSTILSEKFGVYETGFYCDVGAHDGKRLSNTFIFANRGWRGVCVECHPDAFPELVKNRPNAYNVQYAAFDGSKDTVTFLANRGYTELLSGIVNDYDPRHVELIEQHKRDYGGSGELIEVPAKTLDAILDEAGAPLIVDFLSIDVEGGELSVVKGFNKYKAKVITIENNYPDDTSVHDLLLSKGYKFEAKAGKDNIYIL